LYEGKFLVSVKRARVGASEAGPTLDHLKLIGAAAVGEEACFKTKQCQTVKISP